MTSSEWDLPLNEETMKLGKFSKVRMDSKNVYIYNGKAKLTFAYNDSTSEDLRESFIRIGYAEELAERLCTRILNALAEYVKKQAQQQYESEEPGSVEDSRLKPLHLMKYTKGIPYGIPIAEAIILVLNLCGYKSLMGKLSCQRRYCRLMVDLYNLGILVLL